MIGFAIETPCPVGLVFDIFKSICDWSGNCGKPTSVVQAVYASTYESTTKASVLQTYSYNQVSSSSPLLQKNKPSNIICNGKTDGYYSKTNCQPTFLICTAGG